MNIQIKRLSLHNFKGIRDMEIEFQEGITTISGANSTGKTTIVDAFRWLLFGKDSHNSSNFSIKTTKSDGEPVHELEHEVEAVLSIDFVNTTLRKVYKEDWRTRRGESTPYLAGHTNTYFWNGVPLAEKDYKKSVDDLIPEELFKLVTDPLYFNSDAMKWKQRREMLVKMAGGVTDTEVASGNKDFEGLLAMLTANKTLDGLKAEIGAKKKKIKSELDYIPARIDELKRAMPEAQDWAKIEREIQKHQKKIKAIEDSLLDRSKRHKDWQEGKVRLQEAVNQAEDEGRRIIREITNEVKETTQKRLDIINSHRQGIQSTTQKIKSISYNISDKEKQIQNATDYRTHLLNEFSKIKSNQLEIDEAEFSCPTCKRELDPLDIETKRETMVKNFNENKAKELERINDMGRKTKAELECLESELEELRHQHAEISQSQAEAEEALRELEEAEKDRPTIESLVELKKSASTEYLEAKKAYDEAKRALDEYPPLEEDNTQQSTEKQELVGKIRECEKELNKKDQIETTEKRIAELEKQETTMAGELAELERTEFLILEFNKAKIQLVDEKINGLFKLVTFRMFKKNLNGGEEECCDTLINGIPWHDANHAAKVNAGLDIIDSLNEYYGISAPILIDNSEAINEINPIDAQIVRLVVTEDPVLTVDGVPINKQAVA